MKKPPRQLPKAKSIEQEMTNLALLLMSWGNYNPRTPFNQIRKEDTMTKIRERLAELNEKYNSK